MTTLSYSEFIKHAQLRQITSRIVPLFSGTGLMLHLVDNGIELTAHLPYSSVQDSDWVKFHENIAPTISISEDTGAIYDRLITAGENIRATHTRLAPDQVFIERWGARAISSGADQELLNTSPIPTGYDPQNIEYTVPTGRVFYLKGWRVALDAPGNSTNIMISLQIGINKKIRMSLNTNSPSQGASFDPAIPVPAGTTIRIWAHGSNGTTVTFVRFSGIEESI